MRALARWLGGILLALTSWAAVPASVFASEPLTIEVTVISAGPLGVTTMVSVSTLRGLDEFDRVVLTYTGVDSVYGPTTEEPTEPGTYRVTPSQASLSRGSIDSYSVTYVGSAFAVSDQQRSVSPISPPVDEVRLSSEVVLPEVVAPVAEPSDAVPDDAQQPTSTPVPTSSDVTNTDVELPPSTSTPYSVSANAEEIVGTQIAVYALLATAGVAASRNTRKQEDSSDSSDERGELAGVKAGSLSTTEHDFGRGDASGTWRVPLTSITDGAMLFLAKRLAGPSPILGRTVIDGAYLRAMLGALAVVLYPLALTLSFIAYSSTHAIVPTSWVLVAGISAIAVFDAAAGAFAAISFALLTLLTKSTASVFDILALVGLAILWFAPPLIASAFRPFRRRVYSIATAWERLTDYALTLLLTHWAINSMVASLPALARVELPIADHAHELAMVVTIAVGVRMLLEDLVCYHYPQRLRQQHTELPSPTTRARVTANSLRIALFVAVAYPFVGFTRQLFMVTMLFALPILIEPLGRFLPHSHVLSRVVPRGTVKTVIMVIIGGLFATWTQQRFSDPELWVQWSMVILAIPGLAITVLEMCTDGTRERPWQRIPGGMWIYRVGGVFMFVLLWQAQRGLNPLEWLLSLFD